MLTPAINLDKIPTPTKKDITKPMWPGYIEVNHRGTWGGEWEKYDAIVQTFHRQTQYFVNFLKKNPNYEIYCEPLGGKEYWDLMNRAEVFVSFQNDNVYFGRRILDAMACGTVCFIYQESEKAKLAHKALGLKHGINCYFWSSLYELDALNEDYQAGRLKIKKVSKRGKIWVKMHTYKHAVAEIYKIVDEYTQAMIAEEPINNPKYIEEEA
jgi:hypothetical protein